MTENLHDKFTTLEGIVSTNHTEVINALDSILTALGAPPPGPTTTLVDVVTALTQTNTLLAGIRSDQSDQATAALSVLNSIDLSVATIIDNNSLNTQKLLAAMYATFCGCSTGAELLPPIISVTPTPLANDVKCQRIQYYIALFTSWLSKIASYTAATGGITSDVVGTLLALSATEAGLVATGAEVGSALGPPGVIIGAIVSLISGAVYLLGSAFLNDYIVDFNAPVFQHDLLEALYAATNADEGQAAFESVVGAAFAAVPSGILSALWWTAWSNDMYSDTPVVDASAFDSTICAPPELECYDFTAVSVTMTNGSLVNHYTGVIWPNDTVFPAIDTTSGTVGSGTLWTTIDLFGWRLKTLTGTCTIYLNTDASHALDTTEWTCNVHTTLVSAINTSEGAFSIEVCRPL